MRTKDKKIFDDLEKELTRFHLKRIALPGIIPFENRLALILQMIDSIRRVKYVHAIRQAKLSPARLDPRSTMFDPIKASVVAARAGDIEEACWLVFLATHFGKNLRCGWMLTAEVYGGPSAGKRWTWQRTVQNTSQFRDWLNQHHMAFKGKFGNHRKYESLRSTPNGTGAVIESYVHWVTAAGGHQKLFDAALASAKGNPRKAFANLYTSMSQVRRFGRTGRFDYLTMLGKVGLAQIDADATYMAGATGPVRGARLLFDGTVSSHTGRGKLEVQLQQLESQLECGMQVLEDSLCNWQKSPGKYVAFRG